MFNIFYADCIGREGNCLYPHKAEVTDAASLAQAVGHDYVCAEYKNSYRSKANFITSNCLAVEFDNDHSENPDEWVSPEDLRSVFPDVTIGIHYSRNHMKEKNGKPARPKFHAFLEIEPTSDPDAYSAMKKQVRETQVPCVSGDRAHQRSGRLQRDEKAGSSAFPLCRYQCAGCGPILLRD